MPTKRSTQKELLDLGPDYYTLDEFISCQKILFRINNLLGFTRSTLKLVKNFPHISSLMDIGCGGGLFLLHLSNHLPEMKLHGIDVSDEAIKLAKQTLQSAQIHSNIKNVSFELSPQKELTLPKNHVDIILTTLVCHHLTDNELVEFLKSMFTAAKKVVIINDLHRHWLPEFFYKLSSSFLFKNRLISHDGLISIQKGFIYSEWQSIIKQAGIDHYQINWRFPFCWQVILWKK